MHPWNRSTDAGPARLLGRDHPHRGDTDRGDTERGDTERGSAPLEFILVGLLLLVPLIYLVVALGQVQGGALGAEAGARHVARSIATADDLADASARADAVLAAVAREYGLDPRSIDVEMRCVPAGTSCPTAGAALTLTLRTSVALPLVPPVLGLDRMASIPLEATAVQKISRTWGSG